MNKTHLSYSQIMEMEQRHRAQLINSVGGFKSVCLIGTVNELGQTNLAIFNSIVHIGANPPYIAFVMRPDTVERHSLSNILSTGYYTINHLNTSIYKQGHQTSAKYPKDVSEFKATGLTPSYKNNFKAPFVEESSIQLGIEFKERVYLSINNTLLIIGEIKEMYFPTDCLQEDGYIDIEKAGTIACSGLDGYHFTTRLERLPYAKP
ncbi:MAG: hypothetical protein RLZ95_351 [Bacteroidota bacterium]|jgi:flavin reductase (DIM6/NTAB) family NADH-FMN oxidoreductase RutF